MLENVIKYFEMIHPAIQFVLFWTVVFFVVWIFVRVIKWLKRVVVDWYERTFGAKLCERDRHNYSHSRTVPHHDIDDEYEICSRCGDERRVPKW